MNTYRQVTNRQTPQSEPIIGKDMAQNNAGGFGFQVDEWVRLDRFLILGSEGGTYYVGERKLTVDNAQNVLTCLKLDGGRTVARIREVSERNLAPKPGPALLALALAISHGDDATKAAAGAALPAVARTGTHLMMFAEFAQANRGWGTALKRAVAGWFQSKAPEQLAYQVAKYQSREGWSMRDLLRLSHPKPQDGLGGSGAGVEPVETRAIIYNWVCKGWPDVGPSPHPDPALRLIWAMERAKRVDLGEVVALIALHGLTREMIPTRFLAARGVWEALLVAGMPMTAMIRNLATMTRLGVFEKPAFVRVVTQALVNREQIRRARVHPIAVLSALRTYASGRSVRGQNTWAPVPAIVDALNAAFYLAFESVPRTGKRWLLALDVSGSMGGGEIAGVPGLTPREASAALALVTMAVEPNSRAVAFSAAGADGWAPAGERERAGHSPFHRWGYLSSNGIAPLGISPGQRLDDAVKAVSGIDFGGTDCALPMLYATEKRLEIDAFVVLTDSETWAGQVHPVQALAEYRRVMGIPAKLIVVGMTASEFTLADPNDAGMLDVVGFDASAPALMARFVSDRAGEAQASAPGEEGE